MPSGVYVRTEEQKERLRALAESRKGKPHPMSQETKDKISKSNAGKTHSKEAREKMSEAREGKTPWNKGVKTGLIPWNKGKKTGIKPWLGKKLSDETKNKMSESRKHIMTEEYRKRISDSLMGKRHSEETKKKMSESHKGEKSYLWKGGISSENNKIRNSPISREWRMQVFIKDAYTCQKTNVKGCELEAHHICNFADFPELRFDPDNGITLSKEKHREFHKIYGRKDNSKEQMEEFIGRKIDYNLN